MADNTEATTEPKSSTPLSGKLLISGGTDWPVLGRRAKGADNWERPDLHTPHIFRSVAQINFTRVFTSHSGCHAVMLDVKKRAWIVGRNDHGQLGTGNNDPLMEPIRIDKKNFPSAPEGLLNAEIVDAAIGRHHTLLITSTGSVFSAGWNNMGQAGIADVEERLKWGPVNVKEPIIQASAGITFSMLLSESGKVYAMGSHEKGQLGNGTTGEYIAQSKTLFQKQEFAGLVKALADKKIVQISCGAQHTLALDDDGYVYSWGFGGYGRLGHGDQKDVLIPKVIPTFTNPNKVLRAARICAGPTNSAALDGQKMFYLFGKWKTSGDGSIGQPWMTPRVHHDIMAYGMTHLSLGGVTIFTIAEENPSTLVIGFGQNANYGELGLGVGAQRSATKPVRIETLDGIQVFDISAGQNTTFFLAVPPQSSSGEAADIWADLPKYPVGIDVPENCVECGQDKPDDPPLECDKCEKPFHLSCLDPPLETIPEGDWFCPECANEYPSDVEEETKPSKSASSKKRKPNGNVSSGQGKKRQK